jgi:hypothetical protein
VLDNKECSYVQQHFSCMLCARQPRAAENAHDTNWPIEACDGWKHAYNPATVLQCACMLLLPHLLSCCPGYVLVECGHHLTPLQAHHSRRNMLKHGTGVRHQKGNGELLPLGFLCKWLRMPACTKLADLPKTPLPQHLHVL